MANSRELKICRSSDKKELSTVENNFDLSISRNLKLSTVPKIDLDKPKCSILKNNPDLSINRNKGNLIKVPKIDLSSLDKKCEDPRILMYDSLKDTSNHNLENQTNNKTKIGLSELSIDILKILKDAKELINKENNRNCFGLVTYNINTKKIEFYSENDISKIKVLGTVDLTETVELIEHKIPIISVNLNVLEIELDTL